MWMFIYWILGLAAIVDLGAPLDLHLILGAGLFTFLYIGARAVSKYFGARIGATIMKMPETVKKYLGLALLPHSGVSLVFTGIVCGVLENNRPDLAVIVKGTIAAAAVINEIIAVFAAKRGFDLFEVIFVRHIFLHGRPPVYFLYYVQKLCVLAKLFGR